MEFLKKHRLLLVVSIGIIIIYFLSRLYNILELPIFTDEAIYVRWAQIANQDASWRFISLTDGKQPMFVWIAMIFMRFVDDPLLAGRLVSVCAGFFTMFGLWFLSFELFKSKKTAFLTSVIYIFYPLAQVLDRMGLYESLVGAFYIWSLYFSILLVKKIRLDIAYTLGFLIGGGILTKSTNFFSIYLIPFLLILFSWNKNKVFTRILQFGVLVAVAVVIAQMFYGILRLSPLFGMINTKNATFVYPFSEWINEPFIHLASNAKGLIDWLISYLKPGYIILIVCSWFFLRKFTREKVLLFLYFLVPFAALIIFGKTIFPRFIFFMSLPLLCLAGLGLSKIISNLQDIILKKTAHGFIRILLAFIVFFIFIFHSAFVSFQFAHEPVHASIAEADSRQYVNNWTAGWGVKESINFLQNEARNKKIFVATEGTFGLLPASLELYLVQNKNITIKGFWPINQEEFPKEILDFSKKMPAYFIFYQSRVIPSKYPLELVFQVQQGKSDYFLRLYRVLQNG